MRDEALVGLSSDGDPWAFGELARRYAPAMKAVASRLGPSLADVDDIVQESLLQAWQRLDQLDDPAAVRSWLLRLTARKAIDHARRHKSHDDVNALTSVSAPTPSPDSAAVVSAGSQALARALADLPESQRTVWWLREGADMSYEDIAHTLGISVASVRGRLARARHTIMTQLEEWR
ncbi:sigma-70 family RNA polymerase sigma factor [Nanchangia anserum]|uniref:Sigma-70 family RNA polymerase sigma factor n=2 Tax=Nanchangia anserum TaxID=2692125 RepID=A0A8I0KVS7_9ACTO|nr:sigma-70 family RNA polymerase sigma factor [Nanchangia anserum]MBD3689259.1 sigma-70 family RNA polymerase sigma factor [Nanchangia anserum]QOX82637.1 sigma-70 family RNA polymerase sigma factor [Nanchangia anserum]